MTDEYIESSLRKGFDANMYGMVIRVKELQGSYQHIVPNYWFSRAISDSYRMYISGQFYGIISTCQSYVETLGKLICKLNSITPAKNDTIKDWEKLKKSQIVKDETLGAVINIYKNRNDDHHMNSVLNTNALELKNIALSYLKNINTIDTDVFAHTFDNGKLAPSVALHWPIKSENPSLVDVFIRNVP